VACPGFKSVMSQRDNQNKQILSTLTKKLFKALITIGKQLFLLLEREGCSVASDWGRAAQLIPHGKTIKSFPRARKTLRNVNNMASDMNNIFCVFRKRDERKVSAYEMRLEAILIQRFA